MTLFQAFGQFAGSGAVPAVTAGMVLVKPTSITHSGTSATLGANGQVTFSAVTSLSLNGVFTADYDNYAISMRSIGSANRVVVARLRASGSDASGSDYTFQLLDVAGSSATPSRSSSQTEMVIGATDPTTANGDWLFIYGPYLAQPTASRNNNVYSANGARITDSAATHSLSTSYDGITIFLLSGDMTGAVQVYGVRS